MASQDSDDKILGMASEEIQEQANNQYSIEIENDNSHEINVMKVQESPSRQH